MGAVGNFAAACGAALLLAGCAGDGPNRPTYASAPITIASAKPWHAVAICVTERFMTRNLMVTSNDVANGKVIMASADGQVAVRADVAQAGAGTRVTFSEQSILFQTYEPLVRSCV